jgi:hypothetical protein
MNVSQWHLAAEPASDGVFRCSGRSGPVTGRRDLQPVKLSGRRTRSPSIGRSRVDPKPTSQTASHSINSSARASSVGGSSIPSASAVDLSYGDALAGFARFWCASAAIADTHVHGALMSSCSQSSEADERTTLTSGILVRGRDPPSAALSRRPQLRSARSRSTMTATLPSVR